MSDHYDDDRRAMERAEADYLREPAWRTGGDDPDPLALLRALVAALPRCEGLAARGEQCPRVAVREYENAPGWTPACDDPAHVPHGPQWAPRVRDLRYASALRAALAALDGGEVQP